MKINFSICAFSNWWKVSIRSSIKVLDKVSLCSWHTVNSTMQIIHFSPKSAKRNILISATVDREVHSCIFHSHRKRIRYWIVLPKSYCTSLDLWATIILNIYRVLYTSATTSPNLASYSEFFSTHILKDETIFIRMGFLYRKS